MRRDTRGAGGLAKRARRGQWRLPLIDEACGLARVLKLTPPVGGGPARLRQARGLRPAECGVAGGTIPGRLQQIRGPLRGRNDSSDGQSTSGSRARAANCQRSGNAGGTRRSSMKWTIFRPVARTGASVADHRQGSWGANVAPRSRIAHAAREPPRPDRRGPAAHG